MPSPLAHVGIAMALPFALVPGRRWMGVAAWCAVVSVLPDLDVVPMLFSPDGIGWHRGPSHSTVGVLAIGLIAAFLRSLRDPPQPRPVTAAIVVAAASHVLLDWSTGEPGAPARYGVPLLWPLSGEKFIAANPWFGAFGIDSPQGLAAMWSPEALGIYGGEAATVAGAWLVAAGLRWGARGGA